jgi:GNAT superfamily N-acetyltransferase
MGVSIGEVVETLDERLATAGLLDRLQHWDVNAREHASDVKTVVLDRVKIYREHQEQRHGRRILDVFTDYCDEQGLDAELTARPLPDEDEEIEDEQTVIERLFRFYGRHGFVRTGAGNDMFRACRPVARR